MAASSWPFFCSWFFVLKVVATDVNRTCAIVVSSRFFASLTPFADEGVACKSLSQGLWRSPGPLLRNSKDISLGQLAWLLTKYQAHQLLDVSIEGEGLRHCWKRTGEWFHVSKLWCKSLRQHSSIPSHQTRILKRWSSKKSPQLACLGQVVSLDLETHGDTFLASH